MTIDEARKYGIGKVTNSGDEFIDAWRTSKDDLIKEVIDASSFDSEHFHMDGMMKFTRLMTMIKKFEELTLDMCKCMDAQIGEIRDLSYEVRQLKRDVDKLTERLDEVAEGNKKGGTKA